jgi:DNA-binding CsgD family transcriptional regulator
MKYLSFIIAFFLYQHLALSQNLDSLLVVLEETMSKRAEYDAAKEQRIAVLMSGLSEEDLSLEKQFFITKNLISEYEYYSFDKTLQFIDRNIQLAKTVGNDTMLLESNLNLARVLATSGRYIESIDVLDEIDRSIIRERLLKDYFFNYKKCYSELRYFSNMTSINNKYNNLYTAYSDSLNLEVSKLDKNSIEHLSSIEQNYRDANEYGKALEVNANILSLTESGNREYSLATFNRSYMLRDYLNDDEGQKTNLILSAISDIQSSVKDNASLSDLASKLFEEGALEKAHKYINYSLEDARFYNSKLRSLSISKVLPDISNGFEEMIKKQSDEQKQQLIYISILSLFLSITIILIYTQNKKIKGGRSELKAVNNKLEKLNQELLSANEKLNRLVKELSEVDKVKEHYIGSFLNLYSEYISKLNTYRKLVNKYVKNNQMNALIKLSKSKQIIEDEIEIFNKNFDGSFLHIHPNFIPSVNQLLNEHKQIVIKDYGKLNTELRILALIRLGITSSSKIARILRYSVNTIYNYRASIKNRAKDKSNFEFLIKNIQ